VIIVSVNDIVLFSWVPIGARNALHYEYARSHSTESRVRETRQVGAPEQGFLTHVRSVLRVHPDISGGGGSRAVLGGDGHKEVPNQHQSERFDQNPTARRIDGIDRRTVASMSLLQVRHR
jgi:hypothetical protein